MANRLSGLLGNLDQRVPSLRGLGNGFWQPLLIAALIAVPIMLILSSAESLSAEINHVETRSDANQVMIEELSAEKRDLIEQLESQQTSESSKTKRINQLKKEKAALQVQLDAYIAEEQAEQKKEEDKKKHDDDCFSWWCKDD